MARRKKVKQSKAKQVWQSIKEYFKNCWDSVCSYW